MLKKFAEAKFWIIYSHSSQGAVHVQPQKSPFWASIRLSGVSDVIKITGQIDTKCIFSKWKS